MILQGFRKKFDQEISGLEDDFTQRLTTRSDLSEKEVQKIIQAYHSEMEDYESKLNMFWISISSCLAYR